MDIEELKSKVFDDEETTETTPAEIENNVEETQEQPAEQATPNGQVETPAPEVPQPRTYTEDEYNQMVYSFKRQLGKQKDSFTSKLNDSDKRFEDVIKRLGALENPEKPLRREDFKTDDEFIDKLIDAGVEKRWAAKEAQMREEYERYAKEQQEEMEQRKELDDGINKWWPSQEERQKYVDAVQKAYDVGLKDLLEQEQNVLNYLFQTPNQSLVLYKLATDKKAVTDIFSIKNPLMRLMAVRDLENELVRERNTPAPTPAPAPSIAPQVTPQQPVNNLAKPVGKPGSMVEATPDLFDDTDALRNALRGM